MQSARGFEYGVRHIISSSQGDLVDVLLSNLELSREKIQELLSLGAIYLNHARTLQSADVQVGDYLRVHTKPRRFPLDDGKWVERIVFENEHFVVVNKTSGLPVHASVDNILENLQRYVSRACGHEVLVTHRLDVPTQGLIVYAKTVAFQKEFNKLLIARETTKIYKAEVEGLNVPRGKITHYMEPSPRAPKKVQLEFQEGFQECVLEVLSTEEKEATTIVRINLQTGRTHQIRAQMSALGHPVVGDIAYGADKVWEDERIALTAAELSFADPITGRTYSFTVPEC